MSEGFGAGRIHIEPAHRIVAEAVHSLVYADADKRNAVGVKADDFDGVVLYVNVEPEQKEVMRVSIFAPCFKEIKEAVGDGYFEELYGSVGGKIDTPVPGCSLTVAVNLDSVPADAAAKGAPAPPLLSALCSALCIACLPAHPAVFFLFPPPPRIPHTPPPRSSIYIRRVLTHTLLALALFSLSLSIAPP